MVVILVVLTFAVCMFADWLIHRKEVHKAPPVWVRSAEDFKKALSTPISVEGFRIQQEMAYHLGHTWAIPEGIDRVRVGIDDFAQHLMGHISNLRLPKVGDRVVQGMEALALERETRNAVLMSPMTGRVVAVNSLVRNHPDVIRNDPYGSGWLLIVQTQDLQANLNNLLSGELVRRWMEDACVRLRVLLSDRTTLSFQDGGMLIKDFSAHLDDSKWDVLVQTFFLAAPGYASRSEKDRAIRCSGP
jgi:glycine cleavage system H protein